MLARRPLILLALLLPCFSKAQLNGGYTIDAGGGGDYTSFTAAIADLTTLGITGPVVFSVANGTYTEQIVLGNVPGNSNVNTITFRGASLDSSLVSLTSATGTTVPTVRMSGADRVSFEHITISRTGSTTLPGSCVDWETAVADASTSSQYIFFRHCRFTNVSTNGNAMLVRGLAENNERNVVFDRCRFEGGFTGVQWSMDYSQLTLEVRNSVFTGQRSRCIQLMNAGTGDPEVYIEDNDITGPLLNTAIAVDVAHNSNLLQICRNRVVANAPGGAGMSIVCNGSDPVWTVVRNNMIIGAATTKGMVVTGTANGLGIINNSISVAFGRGLELTATGTGNLLLGNAVRATTYPLYHTGGMSFDQADHNVLHASGASWVLWGGAAYTELGALQCATGEHLHSVQADPLFISNTGDLHLQAGSPCLGQGATAIGLWQDLDGEVRSLPVATPPDIGADEVDGICTGLAGTYLIGSSGAADHATFNDALNALKGCGISGPVIFEVEDGTYTERLTIGPIKGASSTNTVTFRGQSLDSTTVTLNTASLTSTFSAPNHLIRCDGCSHIRFEHMTLSRSAAFNYSRVVELDPGCFPITDLRLSHCRVMNGNALTTNASLIYRSGAPFTESASYTLERCALIGGFCALESVPIGQGSMDTVSVLRCERPSGANGFRLGNNSGPITIEGNSIVMGTTRGIELTSIRGAVRVMANTITGGTGSTSLGMNLANLDPPPPARVLMANNAIVVNGVGIAVGGINTRIDLVHNSVHSWGTNSPAFRSFAIAPPTDFNILNNVFSAADDVALTFNTTGIIASNNCFHRSSAGPVVTWNGTSYTTVTALQAGSGTHAASVFADPHFYNPLADLHSYGMELDAAATPLPSIVTDIDGEPRDLTTPDIGCDEFVPQLWAETFNTCGATDPITSNGSGTDQWIYKDRKVVARFNDNGQALGTVDMNVYLHNGPVRQSLLGQHYLDRNWQLITQNPIAAGAIVRLFHSGDEFSALATADPTVAVVADAGVAQYTGAGENCDLADNALTGAGWISHFPASPGAEPRMDGSAGVYGHTAVLPISGELFISGQATPLPVELLSFKAERITPNAVRLSWVTATELNNAGFELWRMREGENAFEEVGWLVGAGTVQQVMNYMHRDENDSRGTSYYKLKQVDMDGSYHWGPIVAVEGWVSSGRLTISPNPATDRISLTGLPEGITSLALQDATGREVMRWLPGAEVEGLAGLQRGLYVLVACDATGPLQVERLVLQ
ncbi:MAG: right-handed parallel beta-helix repeat-containing protein [Flavobacteriales bacterium]